ncbi:nickel pincer cofactor biosynthesis protein LarB [Clostridium sp. DL1XJH146]
MDKSELQGLLSKVQQGEISIDEAVDTIDLPEFGHLGFATIDNHRQRRVGYPEVIYGGGKTDQQVADIAAYMTSNKQNVLVSRASKSMFEAVKKCCDNAEYNELGKTIVIMNQELQISEGTIAIVAAGTSDLPVVEEAYETAKILGNKVEKIVDVGVAGIHRLFNRLEDIKKARVIIVVAGMEGALASVIGGLVDKPIIAVPTSVGYGANLGGIAALLSMLNSCASGVSVVNIDNGFGAAYNASIINQMK